MRRAAVLVALILGWVVLLGSSVAPLGGMILSAMDRRHVETEIVRVPSAGALLQYSLTVCVVATAASLLLGLGPAALMGGLLLHPRKRQRAAVLAGVCLMPLLVPPQVYAYAWTLATQPHRLLAGALPPLTGASAW